MSPNFLFFRVEARRIVRKYEKLHCAEYSVIMNLPIESYAFVKEMKR